MQEFESLHLRHKSTVILIELRWTFSMPENRFKSGFLPFQPHRKQPLRSISTAVFLRFTGVALDYTAVTVKITGIR